MKILISFIILCIAFGCHEISNKFEDNFNLKDSLQLNNKVMDSVSFSYYHYYKNNGKFFIFIKNNKIIGVDINSDEIKFEISLISLDSMDNIGFLYHNSDSIFVSSIHNKTKNMFISLLDKDGKIIKNWNINNYSEKIYDAFFFIKVNYKHQMLLLNNKLYFQASFNFRRGTIPKSSIPIEMELNLTNDSITKIGELPSEYKEGKFYGNHQKDYSRIFNINHELIFSFPICNKLFVYNNVGKLIKTVECKSKYIDRIEPIEKNKYLDLSSIIDGYSYNAQYADIIYDSINNRYLRIVLHKLEKYAKDGKVNNWNNRKWSIIIMDKDLKIINEVLMPDNKFWKYLIPTDKGILMKSIENEININKFYIFK